MSSPNPKPAASAAAGPSLRYRLSVLARVLTALLGAYVLTSLCTFVAARYLPMARVDAVMTATMLSFVIFTCAVIWTFAARSLWRACCGLALPALLLALLAWGGSGAA